jgi:hypothetical protein
MKSCVGSAARHGDFRAAPFCREWLHTENYDSAEL